MRSLVLLLCLLLPAPAWALEIDLLSSTIGVDTLARVLNPIDPARVPDEIDDPAPKFGSAPTQVAQALLLDTAFTHPDTNQRTVRFGEAIAEGTNVAVAIPTTYLFHSTVVVGGNGDPFFDESAEARSFGEAVFMISEQGVGPGTEAFVHISFDDVSLAPEIGVVSASVLFRNLTLGTVLFDSAVDGFPDDIDVTGARVGDQLMVEWNLEIAAEIPDTSATGSLSLEGRFEVTGLGEPVVPEPALLLLVAALVPALWRSGRLHG